MCKDAYTRNLMIQTDIINNTLEGRSAAFGCSFY